MRTPAICTARDFTSITKNTMYRTVPNAPSVSTLKKSHAYSVFQWLLRNCVQVRLRLRSGAGSMPASARMFATVVRPISIVSPRSASRILV
jgi:hypothetical protein